MGKKNPYGGGSWLHIVGMTEERAILRSRDLTRETPIPRGRLKDAHDTRLIVRVARGLYAHKHKVEEARDPFRLTQALAPHAILCTLTAAQIHHLLPEQPLPIHLALERTKHPIKLPCPALWFRFSGDRATEGLTYYRTFDVRLRVTTRARTVADLFMLRKRFEPGIGTFVLERYVRAKGDLHELAAMADVCRVRRLVDSALKVHGRSLPAAK